MIWCSVYWPLKSSVSAGMPNVASDEQLLERQDSAKELQSPRGSLLPTNPWPIMGDRKGESRDTFCRTMQRSSDLQPTTIATAMVSLLETSLICPQQLTCSKVQS